MGEIRAGDRVTFVSDTGRRYGFVRTVADGLAHVVFGTSWDDPDAVPFPGHLPVGTLTAVDGRGVALVDAGEVARVAAMRINRAHDDAVRLCTLGYDMSSPERWSLAAHCAMVFDFWSIASDAVYMLRAEVGR